MIAVAALPNTSENTLSSLMFETIRQLLAWLKISAIHLVSFLSVFFSRIALTYFGCARTMLQVGSKILQIGIQYFPMSP